MLWEREAPRSRKEKLDQRNHPAAASAATDGEYVYVFFGDYGLIAYDVDGKELWRQPLGPFNNVYGMGASPVIVDDKVVLACDQSTGLVHRRVRQEDRQASGGGRRGRKRTAATRRRSSTRRRAAERRSSLPGSFLLTAYDAPKRQAAVVGRRACRSR